MKSACEPVPVSRVAFWIGIVLTVLPALFLVMDAAMKLAKPSFVLEANTKLGFAEDSILPLGIVLLVCTALYLVPRTAVLGAILLTGYLGGAVATHVRAQDPVFNTLFPVFFGVILWVGLLLRDPRLRVLLPWRTA